MKKLVFMIMAVVVTMTAYEKADTVGIKTDNSKMLEQYFNESIDSDQCSVILSDLTHDGYPEMIVLENDGAGDLTIAAGDTVVLSVYSVIDNEVQSIYRDDISLIHSGQRWIYLCNIDDKDYLVKYSPELYTGYGTYNYRVYSLNQDGTENTFDYNEYHFKLPSNNAEEEEMQQILQGVEILYNEVNQYIEIASPLIEVGSDYIRNTQSNYIIRRNDLSSSKS